MVPIHVVPRTSNTGGVERILLAELLVSIAKYNIYTRLELKYRIYLDFRTHTLITNKS